MSGVCATTGGTCVGRDRCAVHLLFCSLTPARGTITTTPPSQHHWHPPLFLSLLVCERVHAWRHICTAQSVLLGCFRVSILLACDPPLCAGVCGVTPPLSYFFSSGAHVRTTPLFCVLLVFEPAFTGRLRGRELAWRGVGAGPTWVCCVRPSHGLAPSAVDPPLSRLSLRCLARPSLWCVCRSTRWRWLRMAVVLDEWAQRDTHRHTANHLRCLAHMARAHTHTHTNTLLCYDYLFLGWERGGGWRRPSPVRLILSRVVPPLFFARAPSPSCNTPPRSPPPVHKRRSGTDTDVPLKRVGVRVCRPEARGSRRGQPRRDARR